MTEKRKLSAAQQKKRKKNIKAKAAMQKAKELRRRQRGRDPIQEEDGDHDQPLIRQIQLGGNN